MKTNSERYLLAFRYKDAPTNSYSFFPSITAADEWAKKHKNELLYATIYTDVVEVVLR